MGTPARCSESASTKPRGRADGAGGRNLAEPVAGAARLGEGKAHRLGQRHPDVQTLAPDQAGQG